MHTQSNEDNAQGQSPNTYTLSVDGGAPAGSTFLISSMPLRQGASILVVGILSDVPRQMAALGRTLLIVAPLILLLCAAGGYWLADRALRPVRAITRTARHINETDLSRRLNLGRRDELGELGATIDGMLERLEAAFARQRQFTADASHELRTPLAVVALVATRTLSQPRTPEEYRQAIATMQRENEAMSRLVNDLLTLARADSGLAAFRREAVDLGEVVLDVVERLAPLAHRNGMTVTLGAMADAHAAGDRLYLTQLATNLLENALTHGARDGGHVCIEIDLESGDGGAWAWLRVADDGQGIAAEHLPHLGQRFYRADPARTRASAVEGAAPVGSGLGLAIARWIVQLHGGALTIRSEPGHGATVEARLPVAVCSPDGQRSAESSNT
jgi:signal transduction histidine kinase